MTRKCYFPEEVNKYNFKELAYGCLDSELKVRYLGLAYLQQTGSIKESAELLGVSDKSITNWVRKVASGGIEALKTKPKGGKTHCKLAEDLYEEFNAN